MTGAVEAFSMGDITPIRAKAPAESRPWARRQRRNRGGRMGGFLNMASTC